VAIQYNFPSIVESLNVEGSFLIGVVSGSVGIGAFIGVLVIPWVQRRVRNEMRVLMFVTVATALVAIAYAFSDGAVMRILLIDLATSSRSHAPARSPVERHASVRRPRLAGRTHPREGEAVAVDRALETKYRIAETAMALFLEHGYESVTVEAVADASRVSRRTVFRHFDGKDELAFPDHSARLELLSRNLVEQTGGRTPVDVVIAATEAVMLDFLSRPELVLRRYRLTRLVPELRRREVLEHERYVAMTRAYLRDHLPADSPLFLPMAMAALIDAMHRSALGNFARSDGTTDAFAELKNGMEWIHRMLAAHQTTGSQLLLAVLPDTAAVRQSLAALRAEAQDLL